MSEWKTVRLGDVCEILDSKRVPITAHERKNGSYPYYGANGIQDYVADYIFDDELVLLAEDGGNFGSKEKPIAYRVSGKCWVNNHAHVLKPKECLDVDYLCDSIKFYDVSTIVNGATRQKLTQSAMVEMKIFLPPLETQKQIAKQLNKCTTLLAKHKQMLETYDTLIKSRFIEMFGDILAGKYKFETRKLGEISEVGSSHRVFTTEFVEHGIPFYRGTEIGELANGKIPQKTYYISEEHYQRLIAQDSKPQIGDLLMPSICNKGQVWMVDTEEPFYYKDGRVLSISPNREIYNSKYLQYFMREKTLVEYPKLGSGSTFAEFKIFLLKDIDILTPPLSLQDAFASFVQQIDKSKFAVQKSLEKAETLYKSLMQEYFA